MVSRRDKAEKPLGEYGRDRIVEKIDYHDMVCITDVDLKNYLKGVDGHMKVSTDNDMVMHS